MSAFQRAQMYSLADANIFNIAIEGVFDDCQDLVKSVSNDLEFKRRLRIGTVNSINWARVMAQVVYYFRGYFAATRGNDERVSFAVPSGNFGNVLAGWIAKNMGLPIERLVLATNENDVLDEFFRSGRYRVRGAAETHATSSPSMDISKASNFERYVFDIVGRDGATVRGLWRQLDTGRQLRPCRARRTGRRCNPRASSSGSSTHADRLATIRSLHRRNGLVIDPHTADGVKVAREHLTPGVPMICLETALPAKFAETIVEAIGREPERPAGLCRHRIAAAALHRAAGGCGGLKAYIEAQARQ
jgi:threonine synthase